MSDAPEPAKMHPLMQRLIALIEAQNFGRRLMIVLGAAFIGLAGADIFHRRHALFSWEGLWGFHAWFGFAAFAFVVLMGWPLRDLLSRPENYYGPEGKKSDGDKGGGDA